MRHLSIARRITLAFAVVLLCAFALGALAIERLQRVEAAAEDMRAHWMPETRALGRMLFLAQRFRVIEAALLMAPPQGKEAEAATLKQISDEFNGLLKPDARRSAEEAKAIDEIGALWAAYARLDQSFVEAASHGRDGEASSLYRTDMREAIRKLQTAFNRAVADNVTHGDAASDDGKRIGADAFVAILAMFGAACAFSLGAGLALYRGVARPIRDLTASMTRLAGGDRAVEIPALDLRNELGAMARSAAVFRDDSLARREALEREAMQERAAADATREQIAAERAAAHARLSEAMSQLGLALRALAEGDLGQRLPDDFAGEFIGVRDDFNEAASKLEGAMREVVSSADSIDGGAKEISSAADDLSRRTDSQAASLEETAAALDQINSAMQSSARSVAHAREVVEATDADAKRSSAIVANAVGAMDAISKSASEIGDFVGMIDEIAFQTNLLAVNAGVEAARAGESGRGFAVVATEVRELALRSAEAAKQIKRLIEASTKQVGAGVKHVGDAGAALTRIVAEISRINAIVNDLAGGAREQAASLHEINAAIREMDTTTQQNAAMAEQSTAATENLSGEARRLMRLVGQFQMKRALSKQNRVAAPMSFPQKRESRV